VCNDPEAPVRVCEGGGHLSLALNNVPTLLSELNPSALIEYYRAIYGDRSLDSPKVRNQLIFGIDSYLTAHPEYDAWSDSNLNTGLFTVLRIEYWMQRTNGNYGEAYNLYQYFDLRGDKQGYNILVWDSSKVNWFNVGVDALGVGLSFLYLNDVAAYIKLSNQGRQLATTGNFVISGYSGINSFSEGDGPGVIFAALSVIPGAAGGAASAASVILDLGDGYYWTHYVPSIPR
jgi:hypothetical protein